jgi:hypothetical protein
VPAVGDPPTPPEPPPSPHDRQVAASKKTANARALRKLQTLTREPSRENAGFASAVGYRYC